MKRILCCLLLAAVLLAGCADRKASENATTGGNEMRKDEVTLRYDSFDGGGPEYEVKIGDPTVLGYRFAKQYHKTNHEELDGAGYTACYSFYGKQPGQTTLTVCGRSPVADNLDEFYLVTVDEVLHVTLVQTSLPASGQKPTLVIELNGQTLYAALEDNASALALTEQLNSGALELTLEDDGGFEKVGELPWTLPDCDAALPVRPGDVMLDQGNRLCICYDENEWELTRLAQIGNVTELLSALGGGSVTASIWLEWQE